VQLSGGGGRGVCRGSWVGRLLLCDTFEDAEGSGLFAGFAGAEPGGGEMKCVVDVDAGFVVFAVDLN
jgi:hypothetical protein